MANTLEINGRELYPIKEASSLVSYSHDYITRLARERKVVATHIGRQWFVDIDSLKNYAESSAIEQELRKRKLSEERKLEQRTKTAFKEREDQRLKKEKYLHIKAMAATACVLCTGLLSGWTFLQVGSQGGSQTQVANTAEVSVPLDVSPPASDVYEVLSSESDVADPESIATSVPTSSIKRISNDVENGVLLLPLGSATASATQMFSDEVMVFTAENGTQAVVRVDANGVPTGKVIPFVIVPVLNEPAR